MLPTAGCAVAPQSAACQSQAALQARLTRRVRLTPLALPFQGPFEVTLQGRRPRLAEVITRTRPNGVVFASYAASSRYAGPSAMRRRRMSVTALHKQG